MLWCCTRSPVDAKSTPPPTMIHEPAGGKPCDTAALSAPHCWKPCNQNHRHKRKRSLLGTAENSAFNEETLRPCRWSNVPPDLRLTTDPRPRLHTPEAVRRANAARLIAAQLQAYATDPEPRTRPAATTGSRRVLWGALVAWTLGLVTGIMLTQVW